MLTHVRDNLNALTQAATTITTTGTQTALALPVGRGDLVIYANNATALTVQGISAGEDGQRLSIFSKGAGTIALNDQNASASAANRIITGASATVDLIAGSGRAELVYDLTTTRWRIAATVATAIVPISAAATVGTTLAVTGVTTVAAGSAAAPSVVSVTGTADTGVFFPAADTVAYSTAGAERLRIGSTGNVGIGTTSPGQKLDVSGGHITVRNGYAHYSQQSGGTLVAAPYTDTGNNMWCGLNDPASVNSLTLGSGQAMLFSVNLAERMRISTTGQVGIGTAPSYQLHVNTDSAGKPGAGGLWTVVSDERIKTDIVPADLDRCYEIVKSVPLKHFGFKPGVYTDEQIQDKHSLGWIAQDVQAVFEKAVSVKPFTIHTPQADGTVQDEVIDDCLDLNSGQMIAALYGCVQALMAKVEALEAR